LHFTVCLRFHTPPSLNDIVATVVVSFGCEVKHPFFCTVILWELFLRPEFSRFVLFLAIVLLQILLQLQKKHNVMAGNIRKLSFRNSFCRKTCYNYKKNIMWWLEISKSSRSETRCFTGPPPPSPTPQNLRHKQT